ncbi:MAG: DUF5060 domain-containing protein, partial [Calditrichaeota bacterium]
MKKIISLLFFLPAWLFLANSCISDKADILIIEQWNELELTFHSSVDYDNPYTDVDFQVEFIHASGEKLIRPGFWDGDNTWKVRFASPVDTGEWTWQSSASNPDDPGLNGKKGKIICQPYSGNNDLI